MRKKLMIGALILGFVAAILLVLPFFLDIDHFRPEIESQLQAALGRRVSLGKLHLSLIPLTIQADAVTIAEDPRFHRKKPFVEAERLLVRPSFWPLLRGQVEIDALELQRPRIELVKDVAGRWNYESLGARPTEEKDGKPGASEPASDSTPRAIPALFRVAIRDGRISRADMAGGEAPHVIDHIDLQLADFTPGRQFAIEGRLELPGDGNQAISWEGQGGPLVQADPAATPLDLKLRLDEVDLGRLQSFSGVPSGQTGAIVSGEINLRSRTPKLELAGVLTLSDFQAGGTRLADPIQVDLALSADLALQTLTIQRGAVTLGTTPLTLSGGASWAAPARVDLQAQAKEADLARLLALGALFAGDALAGVSGSGTVSFRLHAIGPLDNLEALSLTGNGTLGGASLALPALSKPVAVRHAEFQLDRQSVRVLNLAATLGSSSISGSFGLQDFAAPRVRFDLSFDQISIGEWQSLFREKQTGQSTRIFSPLPVVQAAVKTRPSLLERVSGQGHIRVGALRHDALVLTRLQSPVTLNRSVIELKPFSADICGGTQTGAITLDLRSSPARCTVSSAMRKVDANRFVSSVSSLKEVLFGLLASDLDTQFDLGGQTELLRSLDGRLDLDLAKGRLAGVDFMKELAAIGKFAGFSSKPDSFTSFVRLTGQFITRDGIAQTENMKVSMAQGDLAATGAYNLMDHALNLRLTAVLSKEASAKAGGSKVGGFMTTALSDREGRLVLPVLVSGTLDRPRFAPDLRMVAELKMRQYFPAAEGFGEIAGGILNLFGPRDKADKPPPAKK